MKNEQLIPLNLQFFAEDPAKKDDSGQGTGNNQQQAQQPGQQQAQQSGQQQNNTPAAGTNPAKIDYAKIQQMLDGTLAAKEDVVLKSYFKQQGLSQQEAEQAMTAFKAEKAKNQPDVAALREQAQAAAQAVQEAKIEQTATLAAVELGIEIKAIPYVIKIADFSAVTDKDGKINAESIKAAINKVIEAVPQFKPQTENGQDSGYVQIGAAGSNQQGAHQNTQTTPQVATKRWNRFNQ